MVSGSFVEGVKLCGAFKKEWRVAVVLFFFELIQQQKTFGDILCYGHLLNPHQIVDPDCL